MDSLLSWLVKLLLILPEEIKVKFFVAGSFKKEMTILTDVFTWGGGKAGPQLRIGICMSLSQWPPIVFIG